MSAAHVICVRIPLRIYSEANGSHGHWAARAARVKQQRMAVAFGLMQHSRSKPALPVVVTLTRIAPRQLDHHDNCPRSLKEVADEVAHWLGVKDNDPRLTWRYAQRSEGKGVYGCEIAIESEVA